MRGLADGGGCFPTGRHYPGIAHLLRVVAAGLVAGIAPDTLVEDLLIVGIDTETTGRNPAEDRVVELACVVYRGGELVARHQWLIDPGRPIPEDSTKVHGITDEMVAGKPRFDAIIGELLASVEGAIPLAYNAEFDRAFLRHEFARAGVAPSDDLPPIARKNVQWLDPLTWARELQRNEKSRSLSDVCERLGIEIGQAHRAADDAEAALKVLVAFTKDSRVPRQYGAFVQEQKRLGRLFDEERARWRNRV